MAPAATNQSKTSPHFLAGGSYVTPGQEPQQHFQPPPKGQGHVQQQRQAHVFLECVEDAAMVDPTVISDGPALPLVEDDDLLCGLYDFERPDVSEDVKKTGTMTSKAALDEDFWFPADLFTDELDYDLPAPEVVSHSSRADNSTIYSDELELDLFEEIPQTIDVPKRKKAKLSPECEDGQFSTSPAHSSHSLLASWQRAVGKVTGGSVQFSTPASPFQALAPPPSMVTAPFGTATPRPVASSPAPSKSSQINSLLLILCENIPSDPGHQVHDLMTLRLLLLRPSRTPEENHLLDTILILFESYMNAGRTRADIATMVVRDFSFHLQHQPQFAAPAYPPMVSPVLQGQSSLGFLPAMDSIANYSPRPSPSY